LKRTLILPLALALSAAAPALAKPESKAQAPLSAEEDASLALAIDRAKLLYRYDQAAWHTTDALKRDLRGETLATIRGWVVTPDRGDYRVTYYSGDAGAEHRAVYSAVWTGGTDVRDAKVHVAGSDRLSAEEARLIAASDAVPEDGPLRCANRRFNRVILPRSAPDDADLVYLLSPQTETGNIPLGGHHRNAVKDGKIVSSRSFTNSCIAMPLDAKAEGFVISHLLDPTPTEIHFFSVFAGRTPIYVITTQNERLWVSEVVGGEPRARLLDQDMPTL
jgi:hypothetical protein